PHHVKDQRRNDDAGKIGKGVSHSAFLSGRNARGSVRGFFPFLFSSYVPLLPAIPPFRAPLRFRPAGRTPSCGSLSRQPAHLFPVLLPGGPRAFSRFFPPPPPHKMKERESQKRGFP